VFDGTVFLYAVRLIWRRNIWSGRYRQTNTATRSKVKCQNHEVTHHISIS